METKVEKLPGNTYKIDVKVAQTDVDKVYDDVIKHFISHVKIEGFREGKAPAELAKAKLNQTAVRSEALNKLLSKVVNDVIRDQRLKPITGPAIDIKQFEQEKEAEFVITIIERPEINLNDYKKDLSELKIDFDKFSKQPESKENKNEKSEKVTLSEIEKNEILNREVINTLVKVTKIELSDQLVEMERNRMMSNLVGQIEKIGLTIEKYLESLKKTADQLKTEYDTLARNTLHADFILHEIAEVEKIEVLEAEIMQTIDAVPDPKSKEALLKPEQKNYVKSVLIKTKVLESLRALVKV